MSLGRYAGRGGLHPLAGRARTSDDMARVPQWDVNQVVAWVASAGFADFCPVFRDCGVDGDLLLMLSDKDCRDDLGMSNGLLRKRFLRELQGLRKAADYSSCGGEELANFLGRVGPEFRAYTYNLVIKDMSFEFLTQLGGDELQEMLREAGMENSVHRHRLVEALEGVQDELMSDSGLQSDLGFPETQYDVYLTHPRGQGHELASQIKIQLEIRGFSVCDSRLPQSPTHCLGQRDMALVQDTRHFLLILPPGALDSLDGDDPFRLEIATALEAEVNIVPVTDNFQWPDPESLYEDIRGVLYFNCVRWVHDYQDACILKIERFLRPPEESPFLRVGESPLMSGARSPFRYGTPLPSGYSTPGGHNISRIGTSRRISEQQRLMPTPQLLKLPRRPFSKSCASLFSVDSGASGC